MNLVFIAIFGFLLAGESDFDVSMSFDVYIYPEIKPKCEHRVSKLFGLHQSGFSSEMAQPATPAIRATCPFLQHSCCSEREFSALKQGFKARSKVLKDLFGHYFSLFEIIDKISSEHVQSLLNASKFDVQFLTCSSFFKGNALELLSKLKTNYQSLKEAFASYAILVPKLFSGVSCAFCNSESQQFFSAKKGSNAVGLKMNLKMCAKIAMLNEIYLKSAFVLKQMFYVAYLFDCKEIASNWENLEINVNQIFTNAKTKFDNCFDLENSKTIFKSHSCKMWCENSFNPNFWEDSEHLIFLAEFVYKLLKKTFDPNALKLLHNQSEFKILKSENFSIENLNSARIYLYPQEQEPLKFEITVTAEDKGVDFFEQPMSLSGLSSIPGIIALACLLIL